MSYTQEDFNAVVLQLKDKIAQGKVTCYKCHFPLSGKNIKQIDLINGRILYSCSNEMCSNAKTGKTGYRSLKAVEIVIPSILPPTDLIETKAPEPPRPEEVEWQGDDEPDFDQLSTSDESDAEDDDDDVAEEEDSDDDDVNDPDSEG